ncbi:hypothetical protein B5C34_13640 [Pacificimonas flava]|uniref:Pectate lyase superfamily protein domain-containing protein n=2 Tax=Pacificimonas TaxID=1960290 RepID=A0A219B7R7_9SPHN|nr:hypothetical protein B5C34_13640 [Pacificimonas flava]
MAALMPNGGDFVVLTENGRAGEFKYSTSDLSTEVSADSRQGIYVPLNSDTGASGAWVRIRTEGELHGEWFGLAADGTTDDTAALNALIAMANIDPAEEGVAVTVPPGNYSVPNGIKTEIARDNVNVRAYGAEFKITSNPLLTFGDRSAVFSGGGSFYGPRIVGSSADSTTRAVKIQGVNGVRLRDLNVSLIAGMVTLGHDSDYRAQGTMIENVRGEILNTDNAIAIDCRFGGGLIARAIFLSAANSNGQVPAYPEPDPAEGNRSLFTSQEDTIAVKMGESPWDTIVISDSVFGHFQYGLKMKFSSGGNISNGKFSNVFFDYSGTAGLSMDTTGGGAFNDITFTACWFVSVNAHAVDITGTGGAVRAIRFIGCEGRQSGKNNWHFSCQTMENVELVACVGFGANRLSSNDVSDQDDLVILSGGVAVNGGAFGGDGFPFTGICGNQARYGIQIANNLPNVQIVNTESDGVTAPTAIPKYTASSDNVRVQGNRAVDASGPAYKLSGSLSVPTSAATETWYGPYARDISIFGGSVSKIQHNGVDVSSGNGPVTLRLEVGDTWSVTYSATPSATFRNIA